ncbi:MAG TPA: hypothetical protein VGN01_11505 [Acidobacteriaceae bacterium]|jgi:hypothetical protein
MDTLDVALDHPWSRAKIPYLVLVGPRDSMNWNSVTADDLDGAVLLYEYKVAGYGTGVFATDDVSGERTVIAPPSLRTEVAHAACRTLLDRGALTVMITLEGDTLARGDSRSPSVHGGRMATQIRQVPRYLQLADTLDATLASLGRHTRRNLRYYRKRLETEVGVEFVPCADLSRRDFFDFNRRSTFPAAEPQVAWRYNALQQMPDAVLAGVRALHGPWLSLIGGRRHSGVAEIEWQMNLAGLPHYSLSTVMRSYVLEHEITLGTQRLVFIGGTPHSLRHSFTSTEVVDVVVQRRSLDAWMLRRFSRWMFPSKNFLGQTLRDKQLQWIDW